MAMNTDMGVLLKEAVHQQIKKEAEELYEKKKEELLKAFDAEKASIIAGIVLRIEDYVSYKTTEREILITVRKETP